MLKLNKQSSADLTNTALHHPKPLTHLRGAIRKSKKTLKKLTPRSNTKSDPTSPSEKAVIKAIKASNKHSWKQTYADIKAVRVLRKKLNYAGYPFKRLQVNQFGDGLLNSAIVSLAVGVAKADPIVAGTVIWATRLVEYGVAVAMNQRASSDRRAARLAAEQNENATLSPGECKARSARELRKSAFWDALSAIGVVAGLTAVIVGAPIGVVVACGVVVGLSQTASKFQEMAWSALRYVVTQDEKYRKQMVDLQEPMSAYEMALNIGIMTVGFAIGVAAATALYTFAAPVALPVTVGIAAIGAGMMIYSKRKFRKEEQEGIEEHLASLHHTNTPLNQEPIPAALEHAVKHSDIKLPQSDDPRFTWTSNELLSVYRACEKVPNVDSSHMLQHLKKWMQNQIDEYHYWCA